MKFDDLLAQYLYENKTLKLQGIGMFTFQGNVNRSTSDDKEIFYPIEGLNFTYNPKEEEDEAVVVYLTQKLNKIMSLVRSDLESYLNNIRQFINIGKPYTIEGIGTLHKNNQGEYEFTPGHFLPAKEELTPTRENAEHNYHEHSSGTNVGRIAVYVLITIAALAVLGGIGWGISTLLSKKSPAPQTEEVIIDTVAAPAPIDTIKAPVQAISDTVNYKMVFEYTLNRDRALNRTKQLSGYKVFAEYDSITANGKTQYRLFIPSKLLPQDTLRVKDSLIKYFNRPVLIVED